LKKVMRLRVATLACTLLLAAPAAADQLVIRGGGYGHGVGMSQWGADGLAAHGVPYAAILAHYYTGTALGTVPPTATVDVLLRGNTGSASLSGAALVRGASGPAHRLNPHRTYRVALASAGRVRVSGSGRGVVLAPPITFSPGATPLRVLGSALNGVTGGSYRGALRFAVATHGGLDAIDHVHIEDYVRGVVAGEAVPSWPPAALEAQAVATRGYAITSHDGPAGAPFNLYADTRSQLYRGVASETPSTDAAVAATAGQVVTYAGTPVKTYFFSSSGGYTEDIENAFPGAAAEPYLVGVPDPFDTASPLHTWTRKLSFAAAAAKLAGLVRGTFQGIEVLRRGASPRIIAAEVLGSGGPAPVSGDELASRFDLPSTWASFSVLGASGTETPEPDVSGQGLLPPAPGAPPGGGTGVSGGTAAGA
jgi:stage II sporulation protein D